MTNPTPPNGWRIVDKSKDDPRKFSRQKYWANGEWLDIRQAILAIHWGDTDTYAVPIDPGPDHRLIDPLTDDPKDHITADMWDKRQQAWVRRPFVGDPWNDNATYRTPIKKGELIDSEYDAEWFPGMPSEDEVRDGDKRWFAFESGAVFYLSGMEARRTMKIDPVVAWTYMKKPKPYVPPKLPQPGEVWEMRNGERAYVVSANECTDADNDGLVGWRSDNGVLIPHSWSRTGNIVEGKDYVTNLVKHLPNEPWSQDIVR